MYPRHPFYHISLQEGQKKLLWGTKVIKGFKAPKAFQ